LVCKTRFKDLLKCIFSPKKEHSNKVSLYDIFINCMPILLVTLGIGVLQFICTLFAPLFGISFGAAMLGWLKTFGMSCLAFYVANFISAIVIFIAEHKRIQGVVWWRKVLITLLWPLFLMIQFPIDVVALFSKNLGWKVIPHSDTTDFETLNKQEASASADNSTENSEM
jgi:hypothetical protein